MFEAIELGRSLSKKEFKQDEQQFRTELLQLQQQLVEKNVPVLILVAGVEGAGKGDVVDNLNKWFDSRGMMTYAFWGETDEEKARPEYWRYWMSLPSRGSISIMFGGWYWNPIYQHAMAIMDDAGLDEAVQRINDLEDTLHQDGVLIIKLWFHLAKKTFRSRLKNRSEAASHIHTDAENHHGGVEYAPFLAAAERMIRRTDTSAATWHLIESEDSWFRDMSVVEAIRNSLRQRLEEHRVADRRAAVTNLIPETDTSPATVLDTLDMSLTLTKSDYKEQLQYYQTKLSQFAWQAYDAKHSTVIVFEGWDAAGKGGAIRRLTDTIDARLFRSISVAAPTDEELAHHYLWRFWHQVPRAGYMTLYDRSWYGRVLLERVEDLAQPHEWTRAYQEINDFEEQLEDSGVVLLKFWLHISPEEQLRRFDERLQIPWKQHKLTDDDWRNRDKWDGYAQAVNEMVLRTSTGKAPWSLIPANDKLYARIEVLKTVCQRLEEVLKDN